MYRGALPLLHRVWIDRDREWLKAIGVMIEQVFYGYPKYYSTYTLLAIAA